MQMPLVVNCVRVREQIIVCLGQSQQPLQCHFLPLGLPLCETHMWLNLLEYPKHCVMPLPIHLSDSRSEHLEEVLARSPYGRLELMLSSCHGIQVNKARLGLLMIKPGTLLVPGNVIIRALRLVGLVSFTCRVLVVCVHKGKCCPGPLIRACDQYRYLSFVDAIKLIVISG